MAYTVNIKRTLLRSLSFLLLFVQSTVVAVIWLTPCSWAIESIDRDTIQKNAVRQRAITLSPRALQLAKILNAGDDLNDLQNKNIDKRAATAPNMAPVPSVPEATELLARDRLTEKILNASLESQAAWARINQDIAVTADDLEGMRKTRNKRYHLTSLTNFAVRGSLGALGSALIIGKYSTAGNLTQMIGSYSMSVLLSMLAFYEMKGPTKTSKSQPNMLATVFGLKSLTQDVDFPPTLWSFLNTPSPGKQESRKDELIALWNEEGFLGRQKDGINRAAALAGMSDKYKLNIKLLSVRLVMLQDLKAKIVEVNQNLLDLYTQAVVTGQWTSLSMPADGGSSS